MITLVININPWNAFQANYDNSRTFRKHDGLEPMEPKHEQLAASFFCIDKRPIF